MKIFKVFLIMIIGLALVPTGNGFGDQGNADVIVDNTGSTNFSGYRIVIGSSGQVNIMAHGKMSRNLVYSNGQYSVTPEEYRKLIADLEAVMPLSGIKSAGCFKSASFGSKTYVTYKGQTSPDIQCMSSEEFVKDIFVILGTIPRAQNGVKLP